MYKGNTGKIYFADKRWLNPSTEDVYKTVFPEAGYDIELMNWATEEDVLNGSSDAEAILLTNVPITRKVMENAKGLKVVGRCGIGVDTVDIEAATSLGILVCNVPDFCIQEVATHSLTLMLTLYRRIASYTTLARTGTYGAHPNEPMTPVIIYLASSMTGIPIQDLSKAVVIPVIFMLAAQIFVVIFPDLSLFLVNFVNRY